MNKEIKKRIRKELKEALEYTKIECYSCAINDIFYCLGMIESEIQSSHEQSENMYYLDITNKIHCYINYKRNKGHKIVKAQVRSNNGFKSVNIFDEKGKGLATFYYLNNKKNTEIRRDIISEFKADKVIFE